MSSATPSGPEPSRSKFEARVLEKLKDQSGKHLVVRGSKKELENLNSNVDTIDIAKSQDLVTAVSQSKYIVSRSGYSSIMDYNALGLQACIIPTPGQPEQEYLASYHQSLQNHFSIDQDQLDLKTIQEKLDHLPIKKPKAGNSESLPKAISTILEAVV